ncbi:hypothetical protein ABBQ32_012385 [Trebouxia sp. C0010 RCD-2024]
MEEDGMVQDGEDDEEGELSSGADTPEAQTAQPARGISSWMARSVGRLIPFSTSKGPKPDSARKHHSGTPLCTTNWQALTYCQWANIYRVSVTVGKHLQATRDKWQTSASYLGQLAGIYKLFGVWYPCLIPGT